MDELIDIIDREGNVIATKKRSEKTESDLVKIVHIYLFDKDGNIYIQQRAENKNSPNLLDASAGGHVDSGEAFEVAAAREMKEELGIETPLEFMFETWTKTACLQVYKGQWDGDFSLNSEVKLMDKFSFFKLNEMLRTMPYIFNRGFREGFNIYLSKVYPSLIEVNAQDEEIGTCRYDDIQGRGAMVRTASVFVFNSKGELLLQQRSENVGSSALCLDVSAAGHVDAGETYEQAALREAREELGVSFNEEDLELYFYGKTPDENKFRKVYIVNHEGPFTFEKDEVANLVWLSLNDIENMLEKVPFLFTPTFVHLFATYKKYLKNKGSFGNVKAV